MQVGLTIKFYFSKTFLLFFFFFFFSSTVRSTFSVLLTSFCLKVLAAPILNNKLIDQGSLPFPGWECYNITSSKVFWLTYFHQGIHITLCCILVVAHDSMLCGLLLHICSQALIIKHRLISLLKLKKETHFEQLVTIVHQHGSIYR